MTTKTIAVAGVGAIGAAVCRALIDGIDGFELVAASSLDPEASRALISRPDFDLPFVPLESLAYRAEWIVEALPAAAVPGLTRAAMAKGRTLILITSAALLLNPELKELAGQNGGRILVPSGAIAGLDGINGLGCRRRAVRAPDDDETAEGLCRRAVCRGEQSRPVRDQGTAPDLQR